MKKRKSVVVVNFEDPYYKRRKNSSYDRYKQPKHLKSSVNANRSLKISTNSEFRLKDKEKLFQEVLDFALKEDFLSQDSKRIKEEFEKEKLRKLGCDVSEKVNIPYKELQKQIKERKEKEKKSQENEPNLIDFGKGKRNRRLKRNAIRKIQYQKERKRKLDGRTSGVFGNVDDPNHKIGKFKNGILRINNLPR